MTKKVTTGLTLLILNLPVLAFAQPADSYRIKNPLGGGTNSLVEFFQQIITAVLQLGVIVAALAIIYGGYLYVTSGGDETKLQTAQKTLTWALVGTAILIGSNVIIKAITSTIGSLK